MVWFAEIGSNCSFLCFKCDEPVIKLSVQSKVWPLFKAKWAHIFWETWLLYMRFIGPQQPQQKHSRHQSRKLKLEMWSHHNKSIYHTLLSLNISHALLQTVTIRQPYLISWHSWNTEFIKGSQCQLITKINQYLSILMLNVRDEPRTS